MLELGVFSWFGYPAPFERRLGLIKQAGFESTCLWLGDEEEEVRAGRADSMPSLVQEKGLVLDNAHAPYKNCNRLWSASATDVQEAVAEYRTCLLFCRNHAIRTMVMHITEGEDPPPFNARGLSAIEDIAKLAESCGVVLALENTRRSDYLDAVFSNLGSPSIGFCYDSSHDFMADKSKGRILQRWGHLLAATHLSDSRQGDTDDHLVPEEGTIDWAEIGRPFRESNYERTLMLEVDGSSSAGSLPPVEFLTRCYRWLGEFRETLRNK